MSDPRAQADHRAEGAAATEPTARDVPDGVRIVLDLRWTRWRVLAVVAGLAAVAVLTNQPGWYVADARFEHFWNPSGFLTAHQYLWDGVRSLGMPAPYFSPVVGTVLTVFDALGASPALAQRLLHTTYLVVAGLGMVQLLRAFRPRLGTEHVLAGAVYMFNPFTAQFLLPSGLFLHYALAPWLVLATIRGVRGPERWRWAAVFALMIFTPGALNGAALVYAAAPILVAAVYVVVVERAATWRTAAGWFVRAGLLASAAASAAVVQTLFNAAAVAENLTTTELPETVSRTSSWAESWRGLGFWLTYFRSPLGLLRPNATAFVSRPEVVVATHLVPLVALAGACAIRWRARAAFLGMIALALVFMVGLYPVGDKPPFGHLLSAGYDKFLFFRGFRSGYKAGAGWALGVSALAAVAIVSVVGWLARHSSRRRHRWVLPGLASLIAVAVVATASYPFWTGRLYPTVDRTSGVPGYWRDALGWLDAEPAEGRVLILPGSNRTRYRWGYVGDDIFDAFLDRPHSARSSLSQGTPQAADLLVALDERLTSPSYEPGTFSPIARRLGIRWVVVRNDLAWERAGLPRPSDLTPLRSDPDLVRVATFGSPGENTASARDPVAGVLGEADLPPVEVYWVRGVGNPARLADPGTPILVAGSGDAWFSLAAEGLLAGGNPVLYTADLAPSELRSLVSANTPLVVTDTNRRRLTRVTTDRNFESHTLAVDEELDRRPIELFDRAGGESVATFGTARRITASGYGDGFQIYPTWRRPAAAFDGDPATAWRVGGISDPTGEWIRVDFTTPVDVSTIRLHPAGGPRRVTRATVELSSGRHADVRFGDGGGHADFGSELARWFEVRIEAVGGKGSNGVGFAEIEVPGLDLRERIRVPDDVFRLASSASALGDALAVAPTAYLFRRVAGEGPLPEEAALRRSFATMGDRSFRVDGTVRLSVDTPDDIVTELLDPTVAAVASSRVSHVLDRGGLRTVDYDLSTGWEAPGAPGASVELRFPAQPLGHVDIYTATDRGRLRRWSRIDGVEVSIGGDSGTRVSSTLMPDRPCEANAPDPTVCIQRHRIFLPPAALDAPDAPPVTADSLVVTITRASAEPGPFGVRPVRVVEVRPGNPEGPAFGRQAHRLRSGCIDLLEIDDAAVPVSLSGTVSDLLAGEPVSFRSCEPVALSTGNHTLDSTPLGNGTVHRVQLTSGDLNPVDRNRTVGSVDVLERGTTRMRFRVHAPSGGVFVAGPAFHEGWRAEANGQDLGSPRSLDTLAGWVAPKGSYEVVVTFTPQRTYEVALAVSMAAVAISLWLVVRRRKTR